MSSPSAPAAAQHRAIAPAWHTALVVIVLLGFSLMGAVAKVGAHPRTAIYILAMVFEWLLVAFMQDGVGGLVARHLLK